MECLSLLDSNHHCDLQQPQPQLQFPILYERLNQRWKSAQHQISPISCLLQALQTSYGCHVHCSGSSLGSVPVDEVSESMSRPYSRSRQSFCRYLHSEIEPLEARDFLTFRNETVKLLSEIQYKAEERKRQVTTSQQVTTCQVPEATQATAG